MEETKKPKRGKEGKGEDGGGGEEREKVGYARRKTHRGSVARLAIEKGVETEKKRG